MLTKGGNRASRDFDLYKAGDAFATTLTFISEEKSKEWEPNAPLPWDRINTLKQAHDLGIETWVSLEQTIEPIETLKIIDWADFGKKAIELLKKILYKKWFNGSFARKIDIKMKKITVSLNIKQYDFSINTYGYFLISR